MNLAHILAQAARRWPERIALTDLDDPAGRRDISYHALWRDVQRSAHALHVLGLLPGDRVAMLVGNGWEYVQAFFAIASAGMVAVPMNVRLLEEEHLHIVRDSGAKLLIAQQGLLQARPRLVGAAPLGEVIVRALQPLTGDQRAFEWLAADGEPAEPVVVEADAVAAINYTSGTTGLPKGVMLPHRSWLAVSRDARRLLDFGEDEVTLHAAALTHGSGFLVLPTMEVGGRALVCGKFDPALTLRLFAQERVTGGFLVPSMVQMLLDAHRDGPPLRGLALRSLYYAGSPIDPGTLKGALATFGNVLVQSFGQMEMPMFLTFMGREEHRRIDSDKPDLIRSAGRVVPGVQLRVVDDDGRDVPAGEPGEIVVRGEHMMTGYWNRPDATAQAIVDGWLHTGDVGRLDADGYLYIVDRKKDMIISGGSNVYAREVEDVLLRLAGIKEAAVIGLPHPKWGEMVSAVLVSEDGAPIDEAALADFCRSEIADFRRPRKFFWIDTLPRNAYGKVLKRELRTRFAADAANDTRTTA